MAITFRTGADGAAVCAHLDLSVCPRCQATAGPLLVEVYGVHYLCGTVGEADALRAELAAL